MNDDTREKRWQDYLPRPLPRYALLACLALVVVSLGVVLTPARPPEPAEPPFSERARAAALADTQRLKAAASQLGAPAQDRSTTNSADSAAGHSPGAGAAVGRTVTLLTTQAEALLAPGESPPDAAGASPLAALPSSSSPSSPSSSAMPEPSTTVPATAVGLVSALADSGRQRLADAAAADGGTARLLAAVGAAQLLQASALAAGTGSTAPAPAEIAAPEVSGTCPSASTAAQTPAVSPESGQDTGAAGVEDALAAVVRTEAQSIYGYQVALPRLSGDAAKSAAEQLARHDALLSGAASLSRLHCSGVPPREAGYTLGRSFLTFPAAGLGTLEAAALPVYGDLVALSEGETRQWAIAALLSAGRRAMLWGTDPGALPGLDRASWPSQPAAG